MTTAAPIDFGTIEKSVGSVRHVYFELFSVIAQFWEPGRQWETGDLIRPIRPTGFAYQAAGNGQSGSVEPRWRRTLASTTSDDGVTWLAVAAGGNGVNEPSSPSVEVDDDALTATDLTIVNGIATNSRIRATLSGGVSGETYTVTLTFTSGGQTLKGTLVVEVI